MIPLHDDNPTELTPFVNVTLILLCVLAFFWQISLGREEQVQAIYGLGLIPAVLFGEQTLPSAVAVIPPELTIVTSMFLHGGWMHLIGNMLYLWIFGNNIEDAMGHGRFIIFYLLSGVGAAMTQALVFPDSTIPMVGASGAISGVLGAYLLLHPYARVMVLIPLGFIAHIVYLPAMAVLGLWFVLQLLSSATADPDQGGVAFLAHVGGFVTGMMLILIPFFRREGVRFFNTGRSRR